MLTLLLLLLQRTPAASVGRKNRHSIITHSRLLGEELSNSCLTRSWQSITGFFNSDFDTSFLERFFRSVFIAGEKSIHYHSDHRMKDLLFFTIAFQPWCLNAPQSQALPLITELSNGEGANRKRTHDVDLANLATAENTVGLCWSKNRHSVITHTRLLGWLTLAWNALGKICRSFFGSDFGTSFLESIFQVLSCCW